MDPGASTFVAGHRGLVGSALTAALQGRGFSALQLRARVPSSI